MNTIQPPYQAPNQLLLATLNHQAGPLSSNSPNHPRQNSTHHHHHHHHHHSTPSTPIACQITTVDFLTINCSNAAGLKMACWRGKWTNGKNMLLTKIRKPLLSLPNPATGQITKFPAAAAAADSFPVAQTTILNN